MWQGIGSSNWYIWIILISLVTPYYTDAVKSDPVIGNNPELLVVLGLFVSQSENNNLIVLFYHQLM